MADDEKMCGDEIEQPLVVRVHRDVLDAGHHLTTGQDHPAERGGVHTPSATSAAAVVAVSSYTFTDPSRENPRPGRAPSSRYTTPLRITMPVSRKPS
jgi:hypothetical protein